MTLFRDSIACDSMDSSLIAERKSSALDAAEELLARSGVEVTMDELAVAAGVGRRTLFRYFDSREELIAAAVERQYDRIVDTIFEHINAGTPEDLIRAVLTGSHQVAAGMGLAHWQIAADPESHGNIGAAGRARRMARRRYIDDFAVRLWRLADQTGTPPPLLGDTFGLLESLFTYQALRRDFEYSTEHIAETTSHVLIATLRELIN